MTNRSEHFANSQFQDSAMERARWVAVLGKPANSAPRRIAKRKGFFARLLGL